MMCPPRVTKTLVLAVLCLSATAIPTYNVINAPNPNILTSGRVKVLDNGIAFDHPGVRLYLKFAGASGASAILSQVGGTGSQDNYFYIEVDGQQRSAFNTTLWPKDGTPVVVPLFADLEKNIPHEVMIFKSTEAQWNDIVVSPNYVTFMGVNATTGFELLPPQALPKKKIEFLGDSITAGYCNLCKSGSEEEEEESDSFAMDRSGDDLESFQKSWANVICNTLDAQCHNCAWSGYGMVENCCGGQTLASDIWKRTLATVVSPNASDFHGTAKENEWDFTSWTPDAVVINLGTNDGLDRRPTIVSAYNATYLALVQAAAKSYGPNTHFFIACGPMSTAYCEEIQWVIQEASRAGIKAHFLDQRGFLDGHFGPACCGHPSAEVDVAMAKNGSAFIAGILGW
eukprot:m.642117 g.642117  ORF g.642117 m.642117 type:complete len:399 (-) comp22635_c0_seq5:105-1301(-)